MFGNYRIVRKIGVGGMGAVYLAEHPGIGKQVALKVIHRELSANKEVISRFFTEARAANQIGNDHIVDIHDFGQTTDGEHFYIMEYIDGSTIAQLLSQFGILAPARVLHITAQLASGLAAAHRQGIIHRDLKPDNVIVVSRLGDADFVKILDFGLAKVLDTEQKLTAVGVVLGTPQYMSPEACESKRDIDHRSDVYSLGILMFQMLCGRVPFQGESMGEVLIRQVTKLPPAPRAINPAIPPSVEQIVLRCLAKDRSARFQNMLELRSAVLAPEKYLASSPPVVPSAADGGSSRRSTHFHSGVAPRAPTGNPTIANRPEYDASGGVLPTLPPGPTLAANMPAPALRGNHAARTEHMAAVQAGDAPVAGRASTLERAGAKTAFLGGPSRAVQAGFGPDAKTAFMSGEGEVSAASLATQYLTHDANVGTPPPAPPDLSPPTPAHNRTMAIAPPAGYKDHAPPAVEPRLIGLGAGIAAVLFLLLGLGWPGFLRSGGSSAPKAGKSAAMASPARDAGAAVVAIDAASIPVAVVPQERFVRIEVLSEPSGAKVLDVAGSVLLTETPGTIKVAASDVELILVFKHPDARTRRTVVVPNGDARVRLDLSVKDEDEDTTARRPKPRRPKKPRKPKKPKDQDGTLKPSFD